jgi:hypothetical protein
VRTEKYYKALKFTGCCTSKLVITVVIRLCGQYGNMKIKVVDPDLDLIRFHDLLDPRGKKEV